MRVHDTSAMRLKGGGRLQDEFDEDPTGERVEVESDNEYDDDEQTETVRDLEDIDVLEYTNQILLDISEEASKIEQQFEGMQSAEEIEVLTAKALEDELEYDRQLER